VSVAAAVDASREMPVFFPAGQDRVFGILTRPEAGSNDVTVVLFPGGGVPLNTARNRLFVRISRNLAAHGFHALRLDYHGTGESGGIAEAFRLDDPFADDATGAVQWLRQQGLKKVILLGTCFGARTALSIAPDTEDIVGAILVSAPARDFEMGFREASKRTVGGLFREGLRPRNLFKARRWRPAVRLIRKVWAIRRGSSQGDRSSPPGRQISPSFIAGVSSLLNRGIPILFIYGEGEDYYEEFQEASSGRLGETLRRAGSGVDVRTLPGTVHGLTRLDVQDDVLALVKEWAVGLGVRRPDGLRAQ
jgi:pimeloyl-ACP methyl ester carboxylesterase